MLDGVRLVDSVIDEIDDAFGVTLDRAWTALQGGDESAVFRCGDVVVRVAPPWRTDAELAWTNRLAAIASDLVPEVVAPLIRPDGSTLVRIDDRAVSLWPFVEGSRGTRDPSVREQAADLLARLHRALDGLDSPAPPSSALRAPVPDLDDRDLDTWLRLFDGDHPRRQPLHGDFYPGNTLVADGRLVALLDWDEALVGPPERELAWAAWEWGDCLRSPTHDLEPAMAFVDAYRAAGGPARRIGEHDLRQLVRQRLRWEVAYSRASGSADAEYEAGQLRAFHGLRVPSAP